MYKLNYNNDSNIFIDEQISSNKKINILLKNASKYGSGIGRPEFIIWHKNKDLIIIIECKASEKNISVNKN